MADEANRTRAMVVYEVKFKGLFKEHELKNDIKF